MDLCPKCKGQKHLLVVKKDFLGYLTEFYESCTCLIAEKYLQKLGEKIFSQKNIKSSKFTELVAKNLFIQGPEEKFLPHLKYTLIKQGLDFRSDFLDDSRFLRIYLGDDPDLKDIESWQKPFLVFFLGYVGYKNRALPGVICELINIRLLKGFVTWIHYPDRAWGPGCIEYSDEFEDIKKKYFSFVDMRSTEVKNKGQQEVEKEKLNDQLLNGYKT